MLPVASTVQPPIATAQEPIMVCCATVSMLTLYCGFRFLMTDPC